MSDMIKDLKTQGLAILVMVGIAVLSVLGMVILGEFQASITVRGPAINAPVNNASLYGTTVNTTIAAFIAGFAIVGTFATVTMLIIVVKAIIGVVKGLQ